MFGFLKRRAKAAPPREDPLLAFARVIEALAGQAAEVRRSAATLLALRGELARDEQKYEARLAALTARQQEAAGDEGAVRTLARDEAECRRLLERTRAARGEADADATLLLETAEGLARQLAELQAERQSAKARLSAGLVVSDTLKAQVLDFERVLKLDAARDEVEKAHALAELYREEAGRRR